MESRRKKTALRDLCLANPLHLTPSSVTKALDEGENSGKEEETEFVFG